MAVLEKRELEYDRADLSDKKLIDLYRRLLLPRMIEEKMLILLRQGKISKWFSGIGQEAISVGTAMAMKPEEYILPMHRNLGVFTSRDIPLHRLFCQWQGKEKGFTHGHDRSFHFGTQEYNIVGMISHLGPQLGIADGIALASNLGEEGMATAVFTGDGGASEGDFHEALNVASVWDLPVIFIIENNQWGLSTPSNEQFRFEKFVDKGPGYGMDAFRIDGNNILEVYTAVSQIAETMRSNPRPVMLECVTFRRRGHEEASGTKYYPEGIIEEWEKKDPVDNYESYLVEEGVLAEKDIEGIRAEFKQLINDEWKVAEDEPDIEASTEQEVSYMFAEHNPDLITASTDKEEMRFVDAVSDGLREGMDKFDNLVIMGQDIAEYGGVFKITEGFVERYGRGRVRNTPLCESAIIGAGLGLSIKGFRAIVEMQFADFVTCGFNQIVNNLAKIHYRWEQNADVVVRMPTGAGVGAGPFHSQSNEAWFTHTPGLKVVYPAFPEDAKGLLISAIEDPNPVLFFEHKALYRSLKGDVPKGYYNMEIGKASLVREGEDLSIITYGMGVHWAMNALDNNPDISADLVDLRTLAPLDIDAIIASVQKTGRVIILHEDCLTGGIGGEISALISETCFEYLDAPIMREGSLDTPVPFAQQLEDNFLPKDRFVQKLTDLYNY